MTSRNDRKYLTRMKGSKPMNRYVLQAASVLGATLMAILILQVSCGVSTPASNSESETLALDENGRPVGWTEATHSKKAVPGYAVVFPQGEVKRIDITIAPSNWQTMLDDMTNNYGAFGSGGTRGCSGARCGWRRRCDDSSRRTERRKRQRAP